MKVFILVLVGTEDNEQDTIVGVFRSYAAAVSARSIYHDPNQLTLIQEYETED